VPSIDAHRLSYVAIRGMDSARSGRGVHTVGGGDSSGPDKTSDRSAPAVLTVWLTSYRRLGYFPKLETFPTPSWDVRNALKLPDAVVPEWTRPDGEAAPGSGRKQLGVNSTPRSPGVRQRRSRMPRRPSTTRRPNQRGAGRAGEKGRELPVYSTLDLAGQDQPGARVNKGFFTARRPVSNRRAGRVGPTE